MKQYKGQLLHEEYSWECECPFHTGIYYTYSDLEDIITGHCARTSHHKGRLKIIKVVETWK